MPDWTALPLHPTTPTSSLPAAPHFSLQPLFVFTVAFCIAFATTRNLLPDSPNVQEHLLPLSDLYLDSHLLRSTNQYRSLWSNDSASERGRKLLRTNHDSLSLFSWSLVYLLGWRLRLSRAVLAELCQISRSPPLSLLQWDARKTFTPKLIQG